VKNNRDMTKEAMMPLLRPIVMVIRKTNTKEYLDERGLSLVIKLKLSIEMPIKNKDAEITDMGRNAI